MSTFVITSKSPRSQVDLKRFIAATSNPRESARALEQYFERLKGGLEAAFFQINTSTNNPAFGTGTLTLTFGSMVSGTSTATIAGITLTAETSPSGSAQFALITNSTLTAASLVACINAHPTLSLLMLASNVAGVVTLTLFTPGIIGNQVPLVGGTGIVAGAAHFAGGAGGFETVPVTYSRGL